MLFASAASAFFVAHYAEKSREWIARAAESADPVGAPELLADLIAAGALELRLDTLALTLAPGDCVDRFRIFEAATAAGRADETADLLDGCPVQRGADPSDEIAAFALLTDRLRSTASGRALARELAAWNAGFALLAIRDDRRRSGPCDDGTAPGAQVLAAGCFPALWIASPSDPELSALRLDGARSADPPHGAYGFLAGVGGAAYSDWLSLDLSGAPRDDAGAAAFARLRSVAGDIPDAGAFQIDVVGRIEAVSVGDDRVEIDVLLSGASTLGGVRVAAERLCLDAGRINGFACRPGRGDLDGPFATRLTFSAEPTAQIAIEARPIRRFPDRLRGLAEARFCGVLLPDEPTVEDAGSGASGRGEEASATVRPGVDGCDPERLAQAFSVRVTDRLGLDCRAPGARDGRLDASAGFAPPEPAVEDLRCFLTWRRSGGAARFADPEYIVRLRDGALLAQRRATASADDGAATGLEITPLVAELGLASVIGLEGDGLSMLGQLFSRAPADPEFALPPTELVLTVDADLQRAAIEVVRELAEPPAGGGPAWLPNLRAFLPAARDAGRRVAIVVVDADERPGEILAAAGAPGFERLGDAPTHIWDLVALDAIRPIDSPFSVIAWSESDALTAPGSSFKTIVALAAAQAALDGDASVEAVLDGVGSIARLETLLGVRDTGSFLADPDNPRTEIENFDRGLLARALLPGSGTGCGAGDGARLGVCEALGRSLNVYFARLAQIVDLDAAEAIGPVVGPDAEAAERDLRLPAVVDRLFGLDARLPLIAPSDWDLGPTSRLHASPIVLDLLGARARRDNLAHLIALNGVGQAVQATPLAIALAYAAVAEGRSASPRLDVRPEAPVWGAPILDGPTVQAAERLQEIRDGLRYVVRGGTAAGAFARLPSLRDRVWGKTGTAQTSDGGVVGNTLWFAGFAEGFGPSGGRIAFACMVSDASRSGATGGGVCAPAIAEFLRRLDERGEADR